MEGFKGACTDWTSYAEINRPHYLILGRFAEKQGANRLGRLILTMRKLGGSKVKSGLLHISRKLRPGRCNVQMAWTHGAR
jgi:hypothetical protein